MHAAHSYQKNKIEPSKQIKTAHSKPSTKQTKSGAKKQIASKNDLYDQTKVFVCDNCGYKTEDRKVLMQHIDAIHLFIGRHKLRRTQLERK